MASFTAADEQKIIDAIIAKAEGKRPRATEVGGQRREFDSMSGQDMFRLLELVRADIANTSASTTGGVFRKVSFTDAS